MDSVSSQLFRLLGRICGCLEDDCCSRQDAKHAKKTIDEKQALDGNGNLPLDRQPSAAQFTDQDDLVDRLQPLRPMLTMHGHRRRNDPFTHPVLCHDLPLPWRAWRLGESPDDPLFD